MGARYASRRLAGVLVIIIFGIIRGLVELDRFLVTQSPVVRVNASRRRVSVRRRDAS